ncbi:MAG: site-specific integrase [Planctomycetes bacterium]|nr:site-specific integrase [Planctomycetota bacterium]
MRGRSRGRAADLSSGVAAAADLQAAGIAVTDANGKVLDFHALRHTFATRHARSGAKPQVLQRLMRHSSIDLTMKCCTHLRLEAKATAIAAAPLPMEAKDAKTAAAGEDSHGYLYGYQIGENGGKLFGISEQSAMFAIAAESMKNPVKTCVFTGSEFGASEGNRTPVSSLGS